MNLSRTEAQILRAVKAQMNPDQLIVFERNEAELERKENLEETFWSEVAKHIPLKVSAQVATPEQWEELGKNLNADGIHAQIDDFSQMKFRK